MKLLKSKRGKIIFSVAILLVICLVVVAVIENRGIEKGFETGGCIIEPFF